jgi:adenylate cyclase
MSIRRWILRFAPFAMLVLFLALRVIDPPFGQQARNLVFDSYQRFQPRQIDVGASRVRVIDIDDQTLARHGQWPWPRTKLAALAKRLHDAGALVVGFDMVFAEPDRTSPHTLVPTWPKTPEVNALREKLSTLPDHDKEFATAIASLRAVTGFVLTGPNTARAPAARAGFGFAGENPAQYVFTFQGAVPNIRLIEAAARGNGALNWVPDIDQVVRRVPIVLRLHNQLYPTFFAEILRVAQDASAYKIRSSQGSGVASFGSRTGIVAIQVGGATVPTDANGQLLLYYAPRDPRRTIPAWRILDKSFDPETVRGKILLIGVGAAGLVDLRSTPLEPAMAGVEVHAQAIEQVIAGEFLSRPD